MIDPEEEEPRSRLDEIKYYTSLFLGIESQYFYCSWITIPQERTFYESPPLVFLPSTTKPISFQALFVVDFKCCSSIFNKYKSG